MALQQGLPLVELSSEPGHQGGLGVLGDPPQPVDPGKLLGQSPPLGFARLEGLDQGGEVTPRGYGRRQPFPLDVQGG